MLPLYKYPTFPLLSRFGCAAPCSAPALGCLASSTHSSPSNKAPGTPIYHSNLTQVLDHARLPGPYVSPYLDSVTCIMFSSLLPTFFFFFSSFFKETLLIWFIPSRPEVRVLQLQLSWYSTLIPIFHTRISSQTSINPISARYGWYIRSFFKFCICKSLKSRI